LAGNQIYAISERNVYKNTKYYHIIWVLFKKSPHIWLNSSYCTTCVKQ